MHSFISLSFADILSEARKYGLGLFLTHQYLGNFRSDSWNVRKTISTNAPQVTINCESLTAGMYVLQALQNGKQQATKVIFP